MNGTLMIGWKKVRVLVATLVGATLLVGGMALPASAAVHAATPSASDCETLGTLSDNISDIGGGSSFFGKQAGAAADGFRETAADVDDKKIKKAMLKIASVYDDLSKANNVASALTVTVRAGRGYVRALGVYTKASLSCATASITVPKVTVPTITLPSG